MRVTRGLLTTTLFLIVAAWAVCTVSAQAPGQPRPKKATPLSPATPVAAETRTGAPQVVTIVHRLNGLKMFRLLLRSDQPVEAISSVDEAFRLMDDVHTNVVAGLAMEDGQTIAAWLPEADVEFGPFSAALSVPGASRVSPAPALVPLPSPASPPTRQLRGRLNGSFSDAPELTVIGPDGKRLSAQYVGLDGVTGLSILKLAGTNLTATGLATDESIGVGENVRLFGPGPAGQSRTAEGSLFVSMGETGGTISNITRAPSGGVTRFKVVSARLKSAYVGGVALNGAGEAVGIINGIDGSEATVLPTALIRRAATRVLARQASVPKPWLGVRGEPVATLNAGRIRDFGWKSDTAAALADDHRGILLTWIAPGSPAAVASLKAGDVILKVDDEEIQSAEDFSWLLEQAGPSNSIQFMVARPDRAAAEAVKVKLGELLSRRLALSLSGQSPEPNGFSLINQGIETIALRPAVASQLGAAAGLLVVYVEPSTAAFEAGLQPGDVIQSIDGKPLARPLLLSSTPGKTYILEIVRDKKKLVVSLVNPDKNR